MFKKIVVAALFFSMSICMFCSCSKTDNDGKISIVCTDFFQYDLVRNIIGENNDLFSLAFLLDDGSDPHSFQPGFSDIALISDCDLFICIGGSSDTWSREIIKNSRNDKQKTLCMYDLFKGDILPMSNSSCGEEEGDHHHSDHIHTGEDEHFWLSLENAKISVKAICEEISRLHPDGSEIYIENCNKYIAKLSELDGKYREAVGSSAHKTVVFADRFPFAYLARDYSIEYYSAYSGCSADCELSEDRIIFLADTMDALSLKYVCVTETADQRLASTVIGQTEGKDAEIIQFNSCQSVTKAQVDNGLTYIGVMESNLESLIKSLS